MATTQDLIAQLRALGIPDWAMARVLMTQAADTLEALQAAVARLETLAKGQHVELYNARLRLAESEAQNLMARQIILEHGEGVACASPVEPSQARVVEPVATRIESVLEKWEKWALSTEIDSRNHDLIDALADVRASRNVAEESLAKVLQACNEYLPPDGINANSCISKILAVVDPWPLKATQKAASQQVAPNDTTITYMTGYSDGVAWAQASQVVELSNDEIEEIASDLTLYEDYQPESCQADYLDPVKFARAIIAAINAKEQPNG